MSGSSVTFEARNLKVILAHESSLQISEDGFYPFSLYRAEHAPFLQLGPSGGVFSLWLVATPSLLWTCCSLSPRREARGIHWDVRCGLLKLPKSSKE